MQDTLVRELTQKKHLAALGLAVAKINHDLRNMLASAQLSPTALPMSQILWRKGSRPNSSRRSTARSASARPH